MVLTIKKLTFIFISVLMLTLNIAQGKLPTTPVNSSLQMKKALSEIYQTNRFTFFCAQPFNPENKVRFQSCKKCPVMEAKIQWMPIVPPSLLAGHLLCYREKMCINQHGIRFKGIKCCQKTDVLYRQMSQDLHNVVPEISFLKQSRGHYPFGLIPKTSAPLQGCHFYVDKKHKIVEVAPHLRGRIARTYLYMKETYHLPIEQEQLSLFYSWHQQYPVDAWERERNDKIKAIQGNGNPYIAS